MSKTGQGTNKTNPPAYTPKERSKILKISGTHVPDINLTQIKELGEYTTVTISGNTGTKQFTICRPIGITDLNAKEDWVLLPTGEVLGALAKVKDPGQGELNQLRQMVYTDLAVAKGLLIKTGDKYFYPGLPDRDRNSYLNEADAKLKEEKKKIQQTVSEESSKAEKGKVKDSLNRLNRLSFLPKEVQPVETSLQMFYREPSVTSQVEAIHPQRYYTAVGTYGTEKQSSIPWAKGKPLASVSDLIAKSIATMSKSSSPVLRIDEEGNPSKLQQALERVKGKDKGKK